MGAVPPRRSCPHRRPSPSHTAPPGALWWSRSPPPTTRHTRPAAALAAIILPEFLSFEGHFSFSPTNDKLMAGIAATACYLLTKRMVGMIVVGMGVYTALRLLG